MRTASERADQSRTIAAYRYEEIFPSDDLYFVRCQEDRCKIGRTANVENRMKSLRNSSPYPLELMLTIPGHGWQEKVWHKAFAHVRRHLEWFELSPDLVKAMDAARDGKEWIATLTPPADMPPASVWDVQTKFLVDQSPRAIRAFLWRNYIADLEESAAHLLSMRLEATPTPEITPEVGS